MHFQSVTFDLDGTLLDTVPDLYEACRRMLAEIGAAPRSETEIRNFVGQGMVVLVRRCLDRGTPPDDAEMATAVDRGSGPTELLARLSDSLGLDVLRWTQTTRHEAFYELHIGGSDARVVVVGTVANVTSQKRFADAVYTTAFTEWMDWILKLLL